MKVPKEKIAVGIMLLGATCGLTGCVGGGGRAHWYTAYGVKSPLQHWLSKQAEDEISEDATEETNSQDEQENEQEKMYTAYGVPAPSSSDGVALADADQADNDNA